MKSVIYGLAGSWKNFPKDYAIASNYRCTDVLQYVRVFS